MEKKQIFLKDYQQFPFALESVDLKFELSVAEGPHRGMTLVDCVMFFKKIIKPNSQQDLFLDGDDLQLLSISLDDKILSTDHFKISDKGLTIINPPAAFKLATKVAIDPAKNSQLMGLYQSSGFLFTQCEAQGFRRITYFPDRPDVLSKFKVQIKGDSKKYPLLLSNGNRISTSVSPDGQQLVTWEDPFKKPCYLFALVAADLGVLQDQFVTSSGRRIELEIYSAHGTQKLCQHAMISLKKAMQWDQDRFGREYDLDLFMIVAVDDFNGGAMENKGLNIFNSKLVFADPDMATDLDYFRIESVIGHEYFHNWSGNRVTVRDWFHLSLKEGLTVFRDQEFSADLSSPALVRIQDVNDLRASQFPEDAGPNAHPVRPLSCYAVDNFYTSTIYEKGSEIIRMQQTLVGRPGFRRALDMYFSKFDGQAVTIEDFVQVIEQTNAIDLTQFKLWYSQEGTPEVTVHESFDLTDQKLTLKLVQKIKPGQKPFLIPLVFSFYNQEGQLISVQSKDSVVNSEGQNLLLFKGFEQIFVFNKLKEKPLVSLNQTFSAPIILKHPKKDSELLSLIQHDRDVFNKYEVSQNLYEDFILGSQDFSGSRFAGFAKSLHQVFLKNQESDPELVAQILNCPSETLLMQKTKNFRPLSLLEKKLALEKAVLALMKPDFYHFYNSWNHKNELSTDSKSQGFRRLKNLCFYYLSLDPAAADLSKNQFLNAKNMTDRLSALSVLNMSENPFRKTALEQFLEKALTSNSLMTQWLSVVAGGRHSRVFAEVQQTLTSPHFNFKNPNFVYSLIYRFGKNLSQFHTGSKEIYQFYIEQILKVDQLNPQVAARISDVFNIAPHLPVEDQKIIRQLLSDLLNEKLSSNTFELISKTAKHLESLA